jgi:hypothetical protein
MDRATKERDPKNRGLIFHSTDRTSEVNNRFIIWLNRVVSIRFSRELRGHIHIHVATHNVESTLWVGGWVFYVNSSTLSRGNLTIYIRTDRSLNI